MYILTGAQYQAEAEPAFRGVFATNNPSADDGIFTSNIVSRRILHPCYGYVEPQLLMDTIIAAAANLGDVGCYILLTCELPGKPRHCYISLAEFAAPEISPETQLGINFISDYFIYSERGKWGVALSGAYYGLLGGSPEFIEEVRAGFPGLDEQVYEFLQYWKNDRDEALSRGLKSRLGNWLPRLLTHVYGIEIAEKLLRETGLP